jgi:hypothetical protein
VKILREKTKPTAHSGNADKAEAAEEEDSCWAKANGRAARQAKTAPRSSRIVKSKMMEKQMDLGTGWERVD